MTRPKPVVLCILDGWGLPDTAANAPKLAGPRTSTGSWRPVPMPRSSPTARDVGLPAGQMGNSEVGHTNIGAGRVVAMDLGQIDLAIEDGSTVTGRYFAMDRDNRWERVAQAYDAIAEAQGARAPDAQAAVAAAHAADKHDEFVPATVIGDYAGMRDGDGILCFNFRADRVREILAPFMRSRPSAASPWRGGSASSASRA
jgi:bisphosphoglycerate-independent phosphoglycerate mutase (AlkP superfamily)